MGGAQHTGDDLVSGETNLAGGVTLLAQDSNATTSGGDISYIGPVLWLQSDNSGGGGIDGLNAFGCSYPANNFGPNSVGTGVVGVGLENGFGTGNGVVGYVSTASTPDQVQRDIYWETNAHSGVAGRGPIGVTGKGDNIGVKADGTNAVWATGAGTGSGVVACGGDGGGSGVNAAGRGTAAGVAAAGGDQGPGMQATGGQYSTRAGIEAQGGGAGGDGVYAIGINSAAGVEANGGPNRGPGLIANGGADGNGIEARGGDDAGIGVRAMGGARAAGVVASGGDGGGGFGIVAMGGDNAPGVQAFGGTGAAGITARSDDGPGSEFSSGTTAQIRLDLSLPAGDPNTSNIPGQPGDLLAVPEQPTAFNDAEASLWFCVGGQRKWRRVALQ